MVWKHESCALLASRTAEPISSFCLANQLCAVGLGSHAITTDYTELCAFLDLISGLETVILNEQNKSSAD